MKRLLLLLLLIPSLCFAGGASVNAPETYTGMTCRIDGTSDAFLWIPGFDLAAFQGVAGHRPKITLTDSSGNQLVGYGGALGGGETLGSELITGWTNNGFETFTTAGTDITNAVNSSSSGFAYKDLGVVSGQLFKFGSDVTVTSGTINYIIIRQDFGGGSSTVLFTNISSVNDGSLSTYKTGSFVYPPRYMEFLCLSGDETFSALNNTLKRVTDPPSTGIHIYTTNLGSTRGWATQDEGFDYDGSLDMVVTPGR